MSKSIQRYVRENLSVILKIVGVYILGIIIGIIMFNFTDIKYDYIRIVKDIFDSTKQENFEGINIISNGIRNNVIYIGVLYFSLITIVAPIIILLMVLVKAIVTGIYICSIFSVFGLLRGMEVSILSVVLPILFSLTGYIIICTNIISLYSNVSKSEKIDIKNFINHIYFFIIAISLISFSIVIEQLMTSVCLSIYTDIN